MIFSRPGHLILNSKSEFLNYFDRRIGYLLKAFNYHSQNEPIITTNPLKNKIDRLKKWKDEIERIAEPEENLKFIVFESEDL